MSHYFVWEPIFEDDVEKTGKIVKLRFVMYTDKNTQKVDMVMETLVDFDSLLYAVDKIRDIYDDNFSTMIDTGSLSLLETIQCSIDGIVGLDAWQKHKVYLQNWIENQFWTGDE